MSRRIKQIITKITKWLSLYYVKKKKIILMKMLNLSVGTVNNKCSFFDITKESKDNSSPCRTRRIV